MTKKTDWQKTFESRLAEMRRRPNICGSCRFWSYIDCESDGVELIALYGYCKRFPPVLIPSCDEDTFSPYSWAQPALEDGDWCGEYAARPMQS